MNTVNEYLNQLDLRLVFDDTRPGKIYALDPNKTSIYFIVDVDDNCLYVNQNILNIHPEKEIKAFLQEINIQMDIFPHFNDPSDVEDLKPSKQKYFELLMENTTSIKIDFSEYNNYIFLFYMNINMLHCDLENYFFYNNYNSIWSEIRPENGYSYSDTQRIIKETVERHFKNRVTTPVSFQADHVTLVERYFRNNKFKIE